MTDPKHPLGGSTPDDFDALLDALGEPPKPDAEQPGTSPDQHDHAGSHRQPGPSAAPLSPESTDLTSLFDDDADVPTRMVEPQEIKRQAGEATAGRGSSGLADMFAPRERPTQPPPGEPADQQDIPRVLSVHPQRLHEETDHPTAEAGDSSARGEPVSSVPVSADIDASTAARAAATRSSASPKPLTSPAVASRPAAPRVPRPPLGGAITPPRLSPGAAHPPRPLGSPAVALPGAGARMPGGPPRTGLVGGLPPRAQFPLPRPPLPGMRPQGAPGISLPRPPGAARPNTASQHVVPALAVPTSGAVAVPAAPVTGRHGPLLTEKSLSLGGDSKPVVAPDQLPHNVVPAPLESPELAALATDLGVDDARDTTPPPPTVASNEASRSTPPPRPSDPALTADDSKPTVPPIAIAADETHPVDEVVDAGTAAAERSDETPTDSAAALGDSASSEQVGRSVEPDEVEAAASADAAALGSRPDEDGPAIEAVGGGDEGPSLEASSEDDGPVFETEDGEDTILDVSDDGEEVSISDASEDDRGALLAATVTSRRRWLEPAEIAYAGDAKAEVEARAGLLEGEAPYADTPERQAEMYCVAAELVEAVLCDRPRARALYDRAYEVAPESLFVLRALRRLALMDEDVSRARELTDAELALKLSSEDRRELEALAAELEARVSASTAEALWDGLATADGVQGAMARLLAGGSRHDVEMMGDALQALGQNSTGTFAGAASLARARLAEGAAEGDTALTAVQASVKSDPSDVTSWLAMARIAISRENAGVFREALAGLARAAEGSAAGWAAMAIDASTGAILSGAVAPTAVPTAGVGGWLVSHALRDAGHDVMVQVRASIECVGDDQKAGWALFTDEGAAASQSELGRFLVLKRVGADGDATELARVAAALLGDDGDEHASARAALLATNGTMTADEVAPLLGPDGSYRRPGLAAVMLAATAGLDAAEQKVPPRTEGALEKLAGIERALRLTSDVDAARADFESLRDGDELAWARVYATRALARLSGELPMMADALRTERTLSPSAHRVPVLQFLGASIGAAFALEGSADDALDAAHALEGDLAAAELVALFGLRGETDAVATSEVLHAASGDASTLPQQTAAVRAALRLAATEPERAADAIFGVWKQCSHDGVLSTLTLRALPHEDIERRVAVLRDSAARTESADASTALTAWTLVAQALSDAGKPGDAAKALARARTFGPTDPALIAWEESVWLSAGMFSEVAERSFDALKTATTDESRIAAYERLAELDSAFRNDVASAVLTYQAILELAPGHMASLRTLERYFLEHGRFEELLGIYDRLIHHVADPRDATAIGHAAARIAITQAENDQSAGTPFWAAAFERGATDMRTVVALDAEARRGGDAKRFVDVMLCGEGFAVDPREKATFATRAGEALLGLGDLEGAAAAFDRAREAHPAHPVAWAWTAFLRERGEDFIGAAEAYEVLAKLAKVPVHAVAAMLRAAVLWQDKLDNADRARVALHEVLLRDPSNADAFERSLRVMKGQGDKQAELDVLDGRVQAGGEPAELLPLHLRMAEIAEELGDLTRARAAMRAVLVIEPDQQDALRALARMSRTAQDWTAAADAMIRLARLSQDASERNELMYGLGEVFDQHLDDARRAEAAYKRVLQFLPNDVRTLTRLADLYARKDNAASEAETLRQLVAATPASATRRALQIRLAAVLSEKLEDGKTAEEALEAARREAPTDMDVLRAFARLYVRQEAPMALAVLLDRAAGDVRRVLDADLTNAAQLELLSDILKLRGRVDGARVVGAVAQGLGVVSEKLTALSRDGAVPGAGASALTLEVLDLLAPPTVTNSHRELFRLSSDVLEKLIPFDAGAVRAEKLGARPHAMRAEIERWAKVLGLESIDIMLGPSTSLLVMPLGRHPPAVMIPIDLQDTHLARFAIARAMIIVALSLPLTVRLPAREVTVVLAGLLRQFEPMFLPDGGDPARVDEMSRRILRSFPRTRHPEMNPHAFEVIGGKNTDGEGMAAGVVELSNRLAMLSSGDIKGAIEALTPQGSTPGAALTTAPALGRLVRVAISDRFLEARHLTGADKHASIS